MKTDIILCGVGGQGTRLIKDDKKGFRNIMKNNVINANVSMFKSPS